VTTANQKIKIIFISQLSFLTKLGISQRYNKMLSSSARILRLAGRASFGGYDISCRTFPAAGATTTTTTTTTDYFTVNTAITPLAKAAFSTAVIPVSAATKENFTILKLNSIRDNPGANKKVCILYYRSCISCLV